MTTEITEPKYRPFKLRDILFGFFFFAWSQIAILGILFGTALMQEDKSIQATLVILALTAADIIVVFKGYKIIQRSVEVEEDTAPPIRLRQLGGVIAILITMLACTIAVNNFIGISNTGNQDALIEMFRQAPILSAFHLIITAPLCEDICFRYYPLRPGKAWWFRYFISGLIFLATHLTGADSAPVIILYLVPVCFLHGTRLLYRSVRYSMLLHALYNATVVLSMIAIL